MRGIILVEVVLYSSSEGVETEERKALVAATTVFRLLFPSFLEMGWLGNLKDY